MPVNFGGPGVLPSLGALTDTTIRLPSGATWTIPAGRWECKPGPYTTIQEFDPVTQIWRTWGAGSSSGTIERIVSDGANYRLANQTGCPVAAVVTTAGSAYTSAPAVTAGAGGSVWRAVVGGAVNTSVTITNGGTGYTYPPILVVAPPPAGGVPASMHCTLSGGAVNAVTVDDQGAGYSSAPTVVVINDPREGANGIAVGSGCVLTTSLTGSGTITALLCLDHGTGGQTAVPSLTFGSGSAAATAVMCWSITAYTVSATTAGSGYAAPVIISGYDTAPGSSVLTNPTIQTGVKTRNAFIVGATTGTALTATGQTVKDGGIYTAAPTMFAYGFIQGAGAVQAVLGATMGGQLDTTVIWPT